MTKSLGEYARDWQGNAEADALWVILTDSRFYGRKWDPDVFFSTGEEEAARVFRFMEQANITMPLGTFLDFGCGVGRISRALKKRFEGGFGVDISEKMIEHASRYVQGVDFLVNRTDSLVRFPDESVDFVYSHIVLQHIPNHDQRRYIHEFLRILRPGGLAVFQVLSEIIRPQDETPPVVQRVKQFVKKKFPVFVGVKRRLSPPKQFHYDFKYEMHSLKHDEVITICDEHQTVIEAAPATNSCEPSHNGRIEFYDSMSRKHDLETSGLQNRYLSRMYFVRNPLHENKKQHA